jgi:chromosome partitioning protein
MRSIAIINQKGGVGKTTTTTNLAAGLAAAGQRVLAIDLDPQAHLTINFGVEPRSDGGSIYEVMTDDAASLSDSMIKVRKNLWLVPSHIDLAAAETELVSVVGREVILRDALSPVESEFDYMLIDCAPSLGVLTINALSAVNEVFIPLQPHFLALQGLGKLLDDTVRLVAKRVNANLRVTGVVLTMYEGGTRLAGEVVEDVKTFFEQSRQLDCPWSSARVFDAIIRRNVKLAEAPSHGLTIFDYEPRCNGALDYGRLAREVIEQGEAMSAANRVDEQANTQAVESNDASDTSDAQADELNEALDTTITHPAVDEGDLPPSKDVANIA